MLGPVLLTLQVEDGEPAAFAGRIREALPRLSQVDPADEVAWVDAMHALRMVLIHRRSAEEVAELEPEWLQAVHRSPFTAEGKEEVTKVRVTYADTLKEEGRQEGREEGREEERAAAQLQWRETARRVLAARFGELPEALVARLGEATPTWCEAVLIQAQRVESVTELDWQHLA